jgi:hypothetical protein
LGIGDWGLGPIPIIEKIYNKNSKKKNKNEKLNNLNNN